MSRSVPGFQQMMELDDNEKTLDVWMDGDCRACRLSQRWCQRRDLNGRVQFRDFRSVDETDLPVARADLEESMWVRDRDGHLFAGFEAWRRVMAELPGWRWLARLTVLPPLSWVGPALYRVVARNRHRLPEA